MPEEISVAEDASRGRDFTADGVNEKWVGDFLTYPMLFMACGIPILRFLEGVNSKESFT